MFPFNISSLQTLRRAVRGQSAWFDVLDCAVCAQNRNAGILVNGKR